MTTTIRATLIPAIQEQAAYGSAEIGVEPSVWRVDFENEIACQVVSDDNAQGRLTKPYLEMSAVLLQYMGLPKEVDVKFYRAGVLLDNKLSVVWPTPMANKAQSHTSGRLLRGLKYTKRASQEGNLTVASIAVVKKILWPMLHPAASARTVCLSLCFFLIFLPLSIYLRKILETREP